MRAPRPLAWIVAAQLAALVVGDGFGAPGVFALAAPVVVTACFRGRRAFALAIAAAVVVTGGAHVQRLASAGRDAGLARGEHTVDVRVVRRTETARASVLVLRADAVGLPRRMRVFVTAPNPAAGQRDASTPLEAAVVGDHWRLRARLAPIARVANPGAPDRVRAAARRALGAQASLVDERLALRTHGSPLRRPVLAMRALRGRGIAHLIERGRGGDLTAALAFGFRGSATGTRRDFAALGIAHVLAVSGLHVGLVVLGLYRCGRVAIRCTGRSGAGDPRLAALAIALLGAALYGVLAGLGVALVRALGFALIGAAAVLLGRPAAARSAWWAMAALVLAFDPAAAFELGAQLSFAATGAILAMAPAAEPGEQGHEEAAPRCRARLRAWAAGVPGALRLRDALRLSAAALAATAPILAAHGLPAASGALLANLVAVPWVALVLLPVSLVGGACAAFGGLPGLVDLAVLVAGATADVVAVGARTAGAPAAAPVSGGSALELAALAAAGLLAVAAIRSNATAARVGLALAVVGVLRLPGLAAGAGGEEAAVLDVGSGDAMVVRSGDRAMLIDGGAAVPGIVDLGRSRVVPALRALGVPRLDVVVATHADVDHVGGLVSVVDRVPVGVVWLPQGQRADPGFGRLLAVAARRNVPVREVSAHDGRVVLGARLAAEVLWPPFDPGPRRRNAASIVLAVELGGLRLLLPGDLGAAEERHLLASGARLGADVLKLGHHGSASSSTRAWLAAVAPKVAIVSAACDRAGLPSARTLDRVRRHGIPLWWTGRDGAVFVRGVRGARSAPAVSSRAPRIACGPRSPPGG